MDKKTERNILLLIAVLLVINILWFSGILPNMLGSGRAVRQCALSGQRISDCFIIGSSDPAQEIRDAMRRADRIIIAVEGDSTPTQTTAYIDQAFGKLMVAYAEREPEIYAFELDSNGNRISCYNNSIENCTAIWNMQPGNATVLIRLPYPRFGNNEIEISGNTIDLRAKSGADLFALVSNVLVKL